MMIFLEGATGVIGVRLLPLLASGANGRQTFMPTVPGGHFIPEEAPDALSGVLATSG
jgi:hypothetical protein